MQLLFMMQILWCIGFQAFAQQIQLVKDQSQLNWTGKAAFSAYTLNGTVQAQSGVLEVVDNDIIVAKFVVDMPTIDAEIGQLVTHLRSKDFFEVEKYPEATFILTKPIDLSTTSAKAYGNLTIKNKTEPVALLLNKIQKTNKGWHVVGKAVIDRTKFGIYYNSPNYFKKLRENAIADKFELTFDLLFQ